MALAGKAALYLIRSVETAFFFAERNTQFPVLSHDDSSLNLRLGV